MSHAEERRQMPRIVVEGAVSVTLIPPLWPLRLLDISSGGFLISAPCAFPMDCLLYFRFRDQAGTWSVDLAGHSVHSHLRSVSAPVPEYVMGVAFADADVPGVMEAIHLVLDCAVGTVSFEGEKVE